MRCRIPEPSPKLWFFWGQPYMSYLRWVTLRTATLIHPNVILIIRDEPVCPEVRWAERQDFQEGPPRIDWMPRVNDLPLIKMSLSEVAPSLDALGAPDVQTADLLKWHILATRGGTVADMDIVFIKPLPPIERDVKVVRFTGHPRKGYVPVSIMQGRPSQIWADALRIALGSYRPGNYESCGSGAFIYDVSTPELLSDHIVFPWAGPHPWSKWHGWLFGAKNWPTMPLHCCGIHWYAGHNQRWNRRINGPEDLPDGAVAWAIRQTGIGK